MMKSFLRVLGAGFLGFSMQLSAVELKSGHPEVYAVKEGDTLWAISSMFLNDPWLWPELWHANPQISNPHLIYPGDRVKLVYIDGKPTLTVERGPQVYKRGDTVKLTPQVRSEPLDSVIPAIPLELIQSFLVDNRVMTEADIDASPYIIAGDESHIVMGLDDVIFARGKWENPQNYYGVYRKGHPYIDPESKELLGFAALDVGMARLDDVEGEIARFKVTKSTEDMRPGDRMIPTEEQKVDSIFYPRSPDQEIAGEILHVFSGVRNVSQYDVVVLNRGSRDGLSTGDVLGVRSKGAVVKDRITSELVKLPDRERGILMVFRIFEKVSYGLILKAEIPLKVGDLVANPD